jgi:FkbM family methyltransferase
MRHAFVDVGANVGGVSRKFAAENPDHDIYCIEPNRNLIHHITNSGFSVGRTFVTMWAAAWTFDGHIDLFESGKNAASTVVLGKVERNGWPAINYAAPGRVPCFDFSAWLLRTFTLQDDVTVKMDVEGAEYDLLEHMLESRAILLVRRLFCEWHQDRYPSISRERHDTVRKAVAATTELEDWR